MFSLAPSTPTRRVIRFYAFLVALTLLSVSSEALSVGWLDKLKDRLGSKDTNEQTLSSDEVGNGLKEALRVGTETVVANLGKTDGFNLDPAIHIPLPNQLDKVSSLLGKVGMDSMLTDLEVGLNRAAETATLKAKRLFVQAISDMTLDDVMSIYKGPDDAATQYFKSRMTAPLALEMKPVVDESLAEVGAVKMYDDI